MLEIGSMPKKTITKILPLVIFCAVFSVLGAACSDSLPNVRQTSRPAINESRYSLPAVAGRVESADIRESSGLAASRCQDGVLWTHNDSDDGPFLYAMDLTGQHLGTWKVTGADNRDWEDIALHRDGSGKCYLLIGEIGNSARELTPDLKIYRIQEPVITRETARTSRKFPAATLPAEVLAFRYPDSPYDAETLLVHPETGDMYLLTKRSEAAAGVYKLKPAFGTSVTAERIAELKVPAIPNGFVTGGDISPDGKSIVICDYFAAYEFSLPSPDAAFDDIWTQKPLVISLGDRKQGEAVAYSEDGSSIYATSEGKHQPLIIVKKQKP